MCKYCKRLEEVRKNERRDWIRICNSHKRYERKLCRALKECMIFLGGVLACPDADVLREAWKVLESCSKVLFDESEVNDDA